MKILVSACLIGKNCKYDGNNNLINDLRIQKLINDESFVPACPEVLGGLSIPRTPAERIKDRVINKDGIDVTKEYYNGAIASFNILKDNTIKVALLKAKSPSCGKGLIYDGTFTKTLIEGNGVFADLLIENKIKIFTEKELDDFF